MASMKQYLRLRRGVLLALLVGFSAMSLLLWRAGRNGGEATLTSNKVAPAVAACEGNGRGNRLANAPGLASQPVANRPAPAVDDAELWEPFQNFVGAMERSDANAALLLFQRLSENQSGIRTVLEPVLAARRAAFEAASMKDRYVLLCLLALSGSKEREQVVNTVVSTWSSPDQLSLNRAQWSGFDRLPSSVPAYACLSTAQRVYVSAAVLATLYASGNAPGQAGDSFVDLYLQLVDMAPQLVVDPILSVAVECFGNAIKQKHPASSRLIAFLRRVRVSVSLSLRLRAQAAVLVTEAATGVLELARLLEAAVSRDEAAALMATFLRKQTALSAEEWEFLLIAIVQIRGTGEFGLIMSTALLSAQEAIFSANNGEVMGTGLGALITQPATTDLMKALAQEALYGLVAARILYVARKQRRSADSRRPAIWQGNDTDAQRVIDSLKARLDPSRKPGLNETARIGCATQLMRILFEFPLPLYQRLAEATALIEQARSKAETEAVSGEFFSALYACSVDDLLRDRDALKKTIWMTLGAYLGSRDDKASAARLSRSISIMTNCCRVVELLEFPPATESERSSLKQLCGEIEGLIEAARGDPAWSPGTLDANARALRSSVEKLNKGYPGLFE